MAKDLFAGQEGMLTARDDEVLQDLYLLDWATTDQLWPLHFAGKVRKRAYNRLNDLCNKKGVLTRRVVPMEVLKQDAAGRSYPATVKVAFWALSVAARNAVRGRLEARGLALSRLFAEVPDAGRFGRTNPEYAGLGLFETRNAWHLKAVTDVYAQIKGALLRDFGEAGEGWVWRNERRATIPYGDTAEHFYRPDAELVLDGPQTADPARSFHLYFEVQTARSKRSRTELQRRITNHLTASRLKHFPNPSSRALVFVGESPSHVEAASEAAAELGIPAICGPAEEVLPRVKEVASSVARGVRPSFAMPAERPRRNPPADHEPRTPGAGKDQTLAGERAPSAPAFGAPVLSG